MVSNDISTYSVRYISWLISKILDPKWKIWDKKKKHCEEKKIFAPKMAVENALNNVTIYQVIKVKF